MELVELPTSDRKQRQHRRLVGCPRTGSTRARSLAYGYRITSLAMDQSLTPAGRTVGTFPGRAPRALGAPDPPPPPGATRFLAIDFSGGDLSYYMSDPSMVETIATASGPSRIVRTFLTPNTHIRGFRAGGRRGRRAGPEAPTCASSLARRRQGADRDLDLSLAGMSWKASRARVSARFKQTQARTSPCK